MSKFRKDDGKDAPAVNTSALPDIVFMLLFFFMVATTAKENDPGVKVKRPFATAVDDVTLLKQTNTIDFMYIGLPKNAKQGNLPRIVADDQMLPLNQVQFWKHKKMAVRSEKYENIMTCMKIDENIEMDLVDQVKKELQEIDALKVGYSAATKKGRN